MFIESVVKSIISSENLGFPFLFLISLGLLTFVNPVIELPLIFSISCPPEDMKTNAMKETHKKY